MGSSFNHTDLFAESERDHGTLNLLNPTAGTASRYKRRDTYYRRPKSSGANSASRYGDDDAETGTHDLFNHIVVDNDFEQIHPPGARSDSGSTNRTPEPSNKQEDDEPPSRSDTGSISRGKSWGTNTRAYSMIERVSRTVAHFLDSSFPEPAKERSYQKEVRVYMG